MIYMVHFKVLIKLIIPKNSNFARKDNLPNCEAFYNEFYFFFIKLYVK